MFITVFGLAIASFFWSEVLIAYAFVPVAPLFFYAISALVHGSSTASRVVRSVRFRLEFSLVGFSLFEIPVSVIIPWLLRH
jgi:hypothetical protein